MARDRLNRIIQGLQTLFGNVSVPDHGADMAEHARYMAVFLHSLHIGGSQMAMLEMCRLLKESGIQPVICAVHDGACREAFVKEHVPCCICAQPNNTEEIRAFFLERFDMVWLNTVSAYYFAYFFINTRMPVIWWFHETKEVLASFDGYFPHPLGLSANIRLAVTTGKMRQSVRELYERDSALLPLPVRDARDEFVSAKGEKVRFLLPGTYKAIKGHDLLFKAVSLLPEALRAQAEFVCCGYTYPEDRAYRDTLEQLAAQTGFVTLRDATPRGELYRLYADCDCVIAPSRLDSGPMTIIEGMMFEKLTIASDAAGICAFMTDCVNGFVFPAGDAEELAKRMALVIADHAALQPVAAAGRKTYETYFTPAAVRDSLKGVLGDVNAQGKEA